MDVLFTWRHEDRVECCQQIPLLRSSGREGGWAVDKHGQHWVLLVRLPFGSSLA